VLLYLILSSLSPDIRVAQLNPVIEFKSRRVTPISQSPEAVYWYQATQFRQSDSDDSQKSVDTITNVEDSVPAKEYVAGRVQLLNLHIFLSKTMAGSSVGSPIDLSNQPRMVS
jgi:hypothetical protein